MPAAGRALGRVLPLEAAVAPILVAQRAVLAGTDPADYPRAPVEIVLVSLTLLAQLGMELSSGGGGGGGPEARRCGGWLEGCALAGETDAVSHLVLLGFGGGCVCVYMRVCVCVSCKESGPEGTLRGKAQTCAPLPAPADVGQKPWVSNLSFKRRAWLYRRRNLKQTSVVHRTKPCLHHRVWPVLQDLGNSLTPPEITLRTT